MDGVREILGRLMTFLAMKWRPIGDARPGTAQSRKVKTLRLRLDPRLPYFPTKTSRSARSSTRTRIEKCASQSEFTFAHPNYLINILPSRMQRHSSVPAPRPAAASSNGANAAAVRAHPAPGHLVVAMAQGRHQRRLIAAYRAVTARWEPNRRAKRW